MIFWNPRIDATYKKCPKCSRLLTSRDYNVPVRMCSACYAEQERREKNDWH